MKKTLKTILDKTFSFSTQEEAMKYIAQCVKLNYISSGDMNDLVLGVNVKFNKIKINTFDLHLLERISSL
jgi:hypothetical protein